MKKRLTSSHKTNPIAPHPSHWQKIEKPISKQSTFLCCYQTIKGGSRGFMGKFGGIVCGWETSSHIHFVTAFPSFAIGPTLMHPKGCHIWNMPFWTDVIFWHHFCDPSYPIYGKLILTIFYCGHRTTWTVIVIMWSEDWKMINPILSW